MPETQIFQGEESVRVNNARDYVFSICGDFAGATIQLQLLGPDDTTWLDIANGTFAAQGATVVYLGAGNTIRAHVASGTPGALFIGLA